MGTIPTITTAVAGQVLTAAYVNNMKAVSDFWALTPRCYAYPSSTQTATTSVWLTIAHDAEVYDIVQSGDSPSHDNATNNSRLVVRTPGKYEITGQVTFASNATGIRMSRILLNGATGSPLLESHQGAVSGVGTSVPMPPIEVQLAAGDYLTLEGYQNSGGNLATVAGVANSFFRMKLTGS